MPIIVKDIIVKTKEPDFVRLYEQAFPAVAKYIAQNGGDLEEAKDTFQDALVIYYEKLHQDTFEPTRSEEAYLYGISRHLWLRRVKDSSRQTSLENSEKVFESESPQPAAHKLMLLLETTGKKCLDLLQSFYYQKQSMGNIQKIFGYASKRSATVQKFKCLERVRNEVKQKSLQYEDFLE